MIPDLRLAAPAAAAWVAAFAALTWSTPGLNLGFWMALAAWSGGAVLLVFMVSVVRRPQHGAAGDVHRSHLGAALVVMAAIGLVTTSVAIGLQARAASTLTTAAVRHNAVTVVIELTESPRVQSRSGPSWAIPANRQRLEGRVVSVNGHTAEFATGMGMAITVSDPGFDPVFGSQVRARGIPIANEAGERAGWRLSSVELVTLERPPPPWIAWGAPLRDGLVASAAKLPGQGAELLGGLAVGDTRSVSESLDAAMKTASLSHLTAVSGANCALVTAAAFGLAALCGLGRRWRIVIALAALAAFVVLVTPQASVVRAAAMAVVTLIGLSRGRRGGGAAALSVAVIGLLAIDPWYALDIGFALSVAATAGLLFLARPLTDRLHRWMPTPIALWLAVPLAAQLACQPILVLLDPSIATYGVPANILAAPAAPVATVVGMIGCLVLPLVPSVGFAVLQIAWLPAAWIASVAQGASALPAARLAWTGGPPGALLLTASTAALIWFCCARRRPRWALAVVSGVLVLTVAIPLGLVAGSGLSRAVTRPADWEIAMCNIGQGDAVLVRNAGRIALIDTGPEPAPLTRCLDELGVQRIDVLVLTHWDLDHSGGAAAVSGRVTTVLHGPADGAKSERILAPLLRGGADAHEVQAGASGMLGDAPWRALWPPPHQAPGNDAGIVLLIEAASWRGIFLADLGEGAQDRMLRLSHPPPVDVVKVAHHGSADQSSVIYQRLAARLGLVSVGAENTYGHPTVHALELLRAAGTAVVRSDRSGVALVSFDAGMRVWTDRPLAAGERPGSSVSDPGNTLGESAAVAAVGGADGRAWRLGARVSNQTLGDSAGAVERGPPSTDRARLWRRRRPRRSRNQHAARVSPERRPKS